MLLNDLLEIDFIKLVIFRRSWTSKFSEPLLVLFFHKRGLGETLTILLGMFLIFETIEHSVFELEVDSLFVPVIFSIGETVLVIRESLMMKLIGLKLGLIIGLS